MRAQTATKDKLNEAYTELEVLRLPRPEGTPLAKLFHRVIHDDVTLPAVKLAATSTGMQESFSFIDQTPSLNLSL